MAIKGLALIEERDRRKKKKEKELVQLKSPEKKETTTVKKTVNNKGTTYTDRSTISTKPTVKNTTQNRTVTNKDRLSSNSTFGGINTDIRTVKTQNKPKQVYTADIYERDGNYYYKDGKKEKQIDRAFVEDAIKNKKTGVIGRYDSKGTLRTTDEKGNVKKQSLLNKAGYLGRTAKTRAKKGTIAIADAALQEAQNDLQKGENLKTTGDKIAKFASAILNSNPQQGMRTAISKAMANSREIWKDKDKNALQKYVGTLLEGSQAISTGSTQGLKDIRELAGSLDKNLDEKVAKAQQKLDAPVNKELEQLEQEKYNYGNGMRRAAEAVGLTANMAVPIAISMATRNPQLGTLAASVGAKGQATERALQSGADLDTSVKYGTAIGDIEYLLEGLSSGLKVFGKGPKGNFTKKAAASLDEVIERAINAKIKSKPINFGAKSVVGILGEDVEEILSDIFGTAVDKGSIDPNATYTLKDAKDTIFNTSLSTLLTNAMTGGYGRGAYNQNINDMQNFQTKQLQQAEVIEQVNNGAIDKKEANQKFEQIENGTYEQNKNLDQIATQQRDAIDQAVQTGQLSKADAAQEIKALDNTLTSERERINNTQETQNTSQNEGIGVDKKVDNKFKNANDLTNVETGYENTSDNLLGFANSTANNKKYNESKYKYNLDLMISVDGGKTYFEDSIKGMNKNQAIERAKRNWGVDAIIKENTNDKQTEKANLPNSTAVNEVGYHASNKKFDKYDTTKIGTGNGDNTQGKGINLASVKEAVEGVYGDNVYETKINLKNAYTVDDKKLLSTFEKDFGYKTDMENISDELKKKGYDGIVINVNGNKLYTVFDGKNAEIINNKDNAQKEEQTSKVINNAYNVQNEQRSTQESTFNNETEETKKAEENKNTVQQNYEGLNQKEYNEIQRRYKGLIETTGFEEDFIENAKPSDIVNQLKSIKKLYEGDEGFLYETKNWESPEVYKNTKSQYDKINRLINKFEGKINQQRNVETNQVANNKEISYNDNTNVRGDVENEFRNLQEESRGISDEEQQLYRRGGKEIDENLRGRLSRVLGQRVESSRSSNSNDARILKDNKSGNEFEVYDDVDGQTFRDLFEIARTYTRNGELVDLHPVESGEYETGYNDTKNYVSKDGLSGFAITKDGDLISVFNANNKRGWLRAIAPEIKAKAKTLDCYMSENQPLHEMYEKIFGFKVASVMDYNMDYDHDDIAKNHNMPQVAFMVKTNKDIETKHFNKDQYDEALEYRNSLVDNNESSNIPATKNENVITIKNDNLKDIPKDQIKGEDTGVSIDGKEVQMEIPINSKPNKLGQYVPKDGFTKKELKDGKIGDSKFYKNVTERADFIRDEVREKVKDDDNIKHYGKVTNEESMQEAFDDLNTRGTEAIADFFNNDKELTSKDTAMGWLLIAQSQENGDYDFSNQVLRKMRSNATKIGQAEQMYNYYARLTPEGMYRWCGDQLLRAEEIFEQGKTKKWIEANKKRWQLNGEEVEFIKSQMQRVQELNQMNDNDTTTIDVKGKTKEVTVDRAKQVEIAKIQAMIENKIPPEKGKAINALMRISMLGNLKTIGTRNPLGNIALRPVNDVGDFAASLVDYAISKKTGVRTKGNLNLKAQVKGGKKGASETLQDARLGINTRSAKGNRFEIGEGKAFNEQHTGKTKVLNPLAKAGNWMDSKVSFLLDLGDRPFYEANYQQSLENQMRLNGIEKIEDVPDWMKNIAETEGLERTYQDDNNYTKSVIAIRNAMNMFNVKGYGLGDVIIPFAKTPANLTKAIVDYSPAGFVNAITKGNQLRISIDNGQFTPEIQHAFVNQLGKATAGTILYAVGAALAKSGLITGGSDEDKDVADFMKNTLGIQPYSIKIGNKSFTYDWAQPLASGLAIPADIKKTLEDAKEGEVDLEYIIHKSFSTAGSVLLEQSFLQGIKDVLGGYGDPLDNLMSEIEGLPARAVPTLFQQIVTYLDGTKRMSYGNKGIQNMKAQAQAKTPWAKDLPVYRNSLGKEVKMYGGKNNFFNVFINPANYSEGQVTESAEEIYKIYQATNKKDILPRLVSNDLKNEDGTKLTNKQKSDFLKISGDIIDDNVKELKNNYDYRNMSDEDKAEAIKGIVEYAYNKARNEITGHELSSQYQKTDNAVESGYALADYYATQKYLKSITPKKEKTTPTRNRYEELMEKGIDGITFDKFKNYATNTRGESRTGGLSKNQKIKNYIQKLPLTAKQKAALWKDYKENQGFFTYYK